MPKFNVPLKRNQINFAWVTVEAASAKAAIRRAIKLAKEGEVDIDWCDARDGRTSSNGKPEETR